MKVLYDIQDMLEDELKAMSKKEEISSTDLDNIYKMVDVVKDITTVEAMKKAEQEGYSRDYARDYSRGYSEDYANAYGSYRNSYENSYDGRRGRDGDSDGRYSEDSSYRRGRDSMGRYTRDGGYSRHDGAIEHMEEMMRNARNDEEREAYRKAIEQMKR
jgi:hypothetical protein